MKLKIYTLTAFCLFFSVKISAQDLDTATSIGNQIDLTLLVEDKPLGQKFSLHADDIHNVLALNYINYNISLNYQSGQDITSYFRIGCRFDKIAYIDPANPADPFFLGTTAPVIIPPVKKKKVRVFLDPSETYPFMANVIYRMNSKAYRVTIELLKYESYQDYIDGNDNYSVNATKVIYLNVLDRVANRAASLITYPNPSIDHVIIKPTQTTAKNTPLEVTIYTDKGAKLSQHTLTTTSTDLNKVLYNLDTSHLKKGTYYFQLSHGGKTQFKTIIKE